MKRPLHAACALLSALALATGCAAGPGAKSEQLALAVRDYHDALQFGDFQVIARYLRPAARADFLARAYGMEKSLSVLEFTPISSQNGPDGDSAFLVTRVSWYELPSTVVRTENVFVHWKRTDADTWAIESVEGGPLPVPPPEAADAAGATR